MNQIVMQFRLIKQNIHFMANPDDIIFEIGQLSVMTNQKYDNVIKILKNPNVMGEPKLQNKAIKLLTDKFDKRKIKRIKHQHTHRKTDIAPPSNSRKGYTRTSKKKK